MNHNQSGACKIDNFSSDVTFNNNFIFNNHSKGIQQLTVDYKIEKFFGNCILYPPSRADVVMSCHLSEGWKTIQYAP